VWAYSGVGLSADILILIPFLCPECKKIFTKGFRSH
jgi:hypothetical protein